MVTGKGLAGRKVLLVEDEFFILDDMVQTFREGGAEVIGPVGSVREALALLEVTETLDGAVLDINLHGELAYPVADALLSRQVPFVFSTGYDGHMIPPRFAGITRCEKPVDPSKVARMLFGRTPWVPG